MDNSEYIELFEAERTLFFVCRLELENIMSRLKYHQMDSDFKSIKFGIYIYIKKLLRCFDDLKVIADSNSIQSMITLLRMIVDNYAILYLLTTFSNKEEQLLRYYLFLLEATSKRPTVINDFASNIKNEMPVEAYVKPNSLINSDNEASIELRRIIHEKDLDRNVTSEIIKKCNWRFRNPHEKDQKKNQLSWIELYTNAKIPNHHAKVLQNYHSTYVHGLGISLIIESSQEKSPIIFHTIKLCNILMSMIIIIIMTEFKEETTDIRLNKLISDYANDNWNNWV